MRDGVVIVLQRGERFLIGQRAAHKPAPNYWTQVSGKVEAGESEAQTVSREAMEELGCEVVAREKLQQRPSRNGEYLLHYWRSDIVSGEPRINNDENVELRWLTVAELQQLTPVFQEEIDLLNALLKRGQDSG